MFKTFNCFNFPAILTTSLKEEIIVFFKFTYRKSGSHVLEQLRKLINRPNLKVGVRVKTSILSKVKVQ